MFSDTRDIADDYRNRGNSRNLNTSSGCQVNEADRPVKRLRRKRRLLLESEDDEENADEDEVNEAACIFFKENCEKQGEFCVSDFTVRCKLSWGRLFCTHENGLGLVLVYISDENICSEVWLVIRVNSSCEVKVKISDCNFIGVVIALCTKCISQ